MNIRMSALAFFFLVPSFGICESPNGINSREEAFKFYVAQQKEKKSIQLSQNHETLLVTLNKRAINLAPILMPILVNFLLEAARTAACDRLASFVPDSFKLIDWQYVQIDLRMGGRIALEGVSKIAFDSLLYGFWDEEGKFNIRLDSEILLGGLHASLRYAIINNIIIVSNQRLNKKYPDSSTDEVKKQNALLRNQAAARISKYVGLGNMAYGFISNGVYQSLKKRCAQ